MVLECCYSNSVEKVDGNFFSPRLYRAYYVTSQMRYRTTDEQTILIYTFQLPYSKVIGPIINA